jgi:uncharacterized membrane protein YdjX (TVP38/TMEM64 family)
VSVKRFAVLLMLVTAIVAFFALGLHQVFSRDYFLAHKASIDAFRLAHPALTVVIFAAIYIAAAALSIPVGTVLTLAGGAIFGFWTGLLIISFASAIGATLAFLASRFLLRDWVQARFGERLRPINEGFAREGGLYLFALRLTPMVPFWLINLALGVTPMRTGTFYWVSQVGMLTATAVYVYAGTQLSEFRLSPGLIVVLVLLGVLPLIAKHALDSYKAMGRDKRLTYPPDVH